MKNTHAIIVINKPPATWLLLKIFIAALIVTQDGIAQYKSVRRVPIEKNLKELTIKEVFNLIESNTNLELFYQPKDLNENVIISIDSTQAKSVYAVLMEISRQANLKFRQVNNGISVSPVLKGELENNVSPIEVLGELEISGKVTDPDGQELPGTSIMEKGTTNGATTNLNGEYELIVTKGATLIVSFVGYATQEVVVGRQSIVDVRLDVDATQLDELVVVGYGTQIKTSVTGAISSVSSDQLVNRPAANASIVLAGQLPGLTVIQKSGRPGTNAGTLRVRGIGTLGNSDPLVLIDGIEGDLYDLDINDIDNISILKDASSSAIYGVRAANGVILITTKRGSGQPAIRYHGGAGIISPFYVPETVSAFDYATLHNEANATDGNALRYTQNDLDEWFVGSSPSTHPDNDQFDALLNSGDRSRFFHHLSIQGSGDATKYFISLGHNFEGGTIAQHTFRRTNYRVNIDHRLGQKLNIGLSMSGSFALREGNTQSVGQLISEAYRHHPGDVIYFENGLWPVDSKWGGARNMVAYVSAPLGANDWSFKDYINTTFVEYEVVPDLKIKGQLSARNDNSKQDYNRDFFTYYNYDQATNTYPVAGTISGRIIDRSETTLDLTSRLTATYFKSFYKHNVQALIGYEQRKVDFEWLEARRNNLSGNNNITQLGGVSNSDDITNGGMNEYRFRSVFSRVMYNLAGKYLLEVNLRYDGTTRFPKNKRFALFPSFSIGWRPLTENSINSSLLDELKIRASWGRLGNQEIGDYAFLNSYGARGNYVFGTEAYTGIGENMQLSNSEISWETVTMANIGVDAGFLNGKLDVVAEYFIKNTNDILLDLPQPLILGAQSPVSNAGSVLNKGFELSIDYQSAIRGDLRYQVSGNIAVITNKITDLKGTDSPGLEVGDPIQNIYGYVAEGLFQDQDEIDNAPDQAFFGEGPQPGDVRYADINGRDANGHLTGQPDGVVNADDRKVLGSFFPKASFGVTMGFNWRFLDFSMVWQGFAGIDALTEGPTVQPFWGGARPTKAMIDNFWAPDNRDAAFPRLSFTGQERNYQTSSYWLTNASFAKLRNAQLGFTLGKTKAWKNLGLRKVRIYITGENLLHISGFKDIDPEFAHGNPFAWDDSNYPSSRLIMVGLDIKF